VIIETTNLELWHEFSTNILGLMPAASPHESIILFRVDDRPFRFWIQRGERERFIAPGWEFPNKAEYIAALERLRAAGRPVELAEAREARGRHVYELARSSDPAGNAFELFYGRSYDYAPFTSSAGVSRFVTGDNGAMGLGHVVLTAPNFDETHAFYKEALGFGDTDLGRAYLDGGGPDDAGVGFAFLHARNGRHHSLALGQVPESPHGAVHMMLEVAALEDVGRAYDRVLNSKGRVPLSATLGRHVNDKMTSFYMQTPGGFDLEYGWDGLVIDPDKWVPTTSLSVSDWGHKWIHDKNSSPVFL
jgi:3,4-dihydroxy-9,10-secoandrosta-1,3,5(10)-triene-9,17-dione 4,5-dioxygenase